MGYKRTYDKQSTKIASYNSINLATGQGVLQFYAGTHYTGSLLSEDTFYGDSESATTTSSSGFTKNFDIIINRTIIMKGDIKFNIPVLSAGGNAGVRSFRVYVQRIRGATTTTLYDTTQIDWNTPNNTFKNFLFVGSLSTFTTFYAGDTLRLSLVASTALDAFRTATFYFSPNNSGTSATILVTRILLSMPVRIDI